MNAQGMIVITVAFVSFAFLHSLTVSRAFKNYVAGIIGEERMRAYYRLTFSVFSFVTAFAAVYIIWDQPDTTYYVPSWYISWPAHAVQASGLFLMLEAFRPFSSGYFSGFRQASEYLKTGRTGGDIEGIEKNALVTTGVYGLVRHPMYLAGILIFMFEPAITQKTVILRILATAYFVWGTYIEERRFLADFGEEYLEYRRKVPRLNIIAGLLRKRREAA